VRCATNKVIYDLIQAVAPFESQADFDNAGLLIGGMDQEVKCILLALDTSPRVVAEAIAKGAQLLITHHPLMFHGIKEIRDEVYEGTLLTEIIRARLSIISAHTNLDQSAMGAGALIADALLLDNIHAAADKYLFLGELDKPQTAQALGRRISSVLDHTVICYGSLEKVIHTLAIAGGAYDEGYLAAKAAGADALLTGEVRHHNAVAASETGFVIYAGGHYQTEVRMMHRLCGYLQKELDALKYSVAVYSSESHHDSEGYALEEEA
jgi:dinuclear metal center YbgI/SA1388 family protein